MISYKNSINILKKSRLKISNEIINSSNCLNRVTATNIFSKVSNPAADNAAFDGFAINSKDENSQQVDKAFQYFNSMYTSRGIPVMLDPNNQLLSGTLDFKWLI